MSAGESVAFHLAQLLPNSAKKSLRRLDETGRQQAFSRRDVLRARGMQVPPFVLLDGHVMYRRVVETGQVRAALIASPGYMGGLRSITSRGADALYELVALTDGTWATWDPKVVREVALTDADLAIDLLDLLSEFALVINVRLDEQTFESARQRMAAILTTYGDEIFDTRHPVAQRGDLAAMIGTSRVMMYRTLRGLEADGLVKRHRGGGIRIEDREALEQLVSVAAPDEAPAL